MLIIKKESKGLITWSIEQDYDYDDKRYEFYLIVKIAGVTVIFASITDIFRR